MKGLGLGIKRPRYWITVYLHILFLHLKQSQDNEVYICTYAAHPVSAESVSRITWTDETAREVGTRMITASVVFLAFNNIYNGSNSNVNFVIHIIGC